ncbi:hypothetical protein LJC33_02505 [Eubacteriales bacterium OttesenSCG-928-N13]|nr:hypothetical protein [Eubacteriales bacterium OttesenSCG-928-N13]
MYKTAKILTGIAMVLLVFLLVVMFGVYVRASLVEFSAIPATQDPVLATELIATAQRDDMASDLYKHPTSSDLNNYKLITIKVQASNIGILSAEWLQLRVASVVGDVALFPGSPTDLRPLGGSETITATLLTESQTDETSREIWLQYYVFGRKMQIAIRG